MNFRIRRVQLDIKSSEAKAGLMVRLWPEPSRDPAAIKEKEETVSSCPAKWWVVSTLQRTGIGGVWFQACTTANVCVLLNLIPLELLHVSAFGST